MVNPLKRLLVLVLAPLLFAACSAGGPATPENTRTVRGNPDCPPPNLVMLSGDCTAPPPLSFEGAG